MRDILTLTTYFKQNKDSQNYSDNFKLRIHRALSWLKQAETTEDLDTKFIFLWIAFNSAYAKEIKNLENKERVNLNEFLLRICSLDEEQTIYTLVWKNFSQPIRLLTNNHFIFQPFWRFHNGDITERQYLKEEKNEQRHLLSALEKQNTPQILSILFGRLYTLRNQIIHGGATFNSSVNREQLKVSCQLLSLFLPTMLEIMMNNYDKLDWGKPFYPLVKNK
ncbi:hypothetical protein L4F91_08025 [Avibacterium sp. 20-126]|uniref:hypothetical protein n=1 Tax=Avibacterium sp. 20-126 TaxID=2911524 RepID=UPI00218C207C|nr:hypothetical protein L4F91_08025 [Avibacterium sp. 20-126]